MIAKKGDKLRAVIEGRRKGVDFLYANQKEAAASLAKAYNLPPDIAGQRAGRRPEAELRPGGAAARSKMQLMELTAQSLIGDRRPSGAVDWKAAVDERFIPKDLQSKTQ